jgi:bifunctional enzyme CysN/CysC/sulfate adenylyltransferase subunit 1
MHPKALQSGKKYWLKHTTHTVQAAITEVTHRINITSLEQEPASAGLALNDIGEIRLRTSSPLVFDGYATNRLTGSFILIEQGTHATVAAGMLHPPRELVRPEDADFVI